MKMRKFTYCAQVKQKRNFLQKKKSKLEFHHFFQHFISVGKENTPIFPAVIIFINKTFWAFESLVQARPGAIVLSCPILSDLHVYCEVIYKNCRFRMNVMWGRVT